MKEVEIKQLEVGNITVPYADVQREFPAELVASAIDAIAVWEEAFPGDESTWIQRHHSIPSPLVRIDATIVDGELRLFEIDDRPAGVGITREINPDFAERLEAVLETWPDVVAVVSEDPRRRLRDDHLWLPTAPLETDHEVVFVRAFPDEQKFHHLEGRSVSTLRREGDKGYGERMGLWQTVRHFGELSVDEPFVIKPTVGRWSEGVMVFLPDDIKEQFRLREGERVGGTFKKSDVRRHIEKEAEKGRTVFRQDFHPPMKSELGDRFPWMIFRAFFGKDLQKGEWQSLGGKWNARPSLVIHGAGDTLTGPLVSEKS